MCDFSRDSPAQERGEGDANYHFNSRPNVP